MIGNIYGYVRVSSKDQNEDRQLIALSKYKILEENIFVDKKSGENFDRPNYKKLISKLKQNDLVIVKSIDRLGRNYKEIIEQWRIITQIKKADIIVLDMPLLDTTKSKDLIGTLISDIVLQLLSYVAQNERENIKQRQAEGIKAAKVKGIKFGRPPKYNSKEYKDIIKKYKEKSITKKEAIEIMGVCETTFYKIIKEFNNNSN